MRTIDHSTGGPYLVAEQSFCVVVLARLLELFVRKAAETLLLRAFLGFSTNSLELKYIVVISLPRRSAIQGCLCLQNQPRKLSLRMVCALLNLEVDLLCRSLTPYTLPRDQLPIPIHPMKVLALVLFGC